MVASPLMRWAYWNVPGANPSSIYYFTPFRLDGLAAGALLAGLIRSCAGTPKRLLSVAGVAGLAAVIGTALGGSAIWSRTREIGMVLQFAVASYGFAALVAVGIAAGPAIGARWRWLAPLAWVGSISYCVYLIHQFVYHLLEPWSGRLIAGLGPLPALFAIVASATALCFAIAWASKRWFEGPILELKRFFPTRPPSDAAAERESDAALPASMVESKRGPAGDLATARSIAASAAE
jgi:peptidoglycan/LPS O-acetylase OafA/YrhL